MGLNFSLAHFNVSWATYYSLWIFSSSSGKLRVGQVSHDRLSFSVRLINLYILIFHQQSSFPMREWNNDMPPSAQPSLNYMAPEYVLTMSCDTASDMFSLGMLMYSVMNRGKPLYECNDSMTTYKRNCEQVSYNWYGVD